MSAVQQQVSTLIVGTITSVAGGNATVTMTKSGMTGTPLAISVAVTNTDTATIVAGKMVTAMNAVANFAAVCNAYAVGATLYVLVLVPAANDSTMNIAYTNGTCTGLTPDATSDVVAYGSATGPTYGYCTLTEAKARLWPSGASPYMVEDTLLVDLIDFASRKVDRDSNRRFYVNATDETRYYRASNPGRFFTDDIVSVTSIKIDSDSDRTYETTLAATDYDLMPINATLNGEPYTYIERPPLGQYPYPSHNQSIQVVGKFGYPSVPYEAKEACLTKVQIEYWIKNGFGGETPKQTIETLETHYQDMINALRKNWA